MNACIWTIKGLDFGLHAASLLFSTADPRPNSLPVSPQKMTRPLPKTHVFKRVPQSGDAASQLEIALDVYLPQLSPGQKIPAVAWWHGGGLLQGTRKAVPPHFLDAPEKHGMAFISCDYRLAPQTRLPEILADVSDALTFIYSKFPRLYPEIDLDKLAVAGSSAGGWLSLMIGLGMIPSWKPAKKPAAVLALYPITDTTDPFFAQPQPPPRLPEVERQTVAPFLDPSSPEVAYSEAESDRSNFYSWMVQTGTLNNLLLDGTGLDPKTFSIGQKLRSMSENECSNLPPFYINHGNADGFVPFRQSVDVVQTLQDKGATVVFDIFEGKDHRNDWFFVEDTLGIYIFLNNIWKIG